MTQRRRSKRGKYRVKSARPALLTLEEKLAVARRSTFKLQNGYCRPKELDDLLGRVALHVAALFDASFQAHPDTIPGLVERLQRVDAAFTETPDAVVTDTTEPPAWVFNDPTEPRAAAVDALRTSQSSMLAALTHSHSHLEG